MTKTGNQRWTIEAKPWGLLFDYLSYLSTLIPMAEYLARYEVNLATHSSASCHIP